MKRYILAGALLILSALSLSAETPRWLRQNSISRNEWSLIKYNAAVYREIFGYGKLHSYAYLFTFFLPTYFWKRIQNKMTEWRNRHLWQNFNAQ